MARFRESPPEAAPERLTRFCWREWPDIPPEEAIKRWHLARMAWHEEHSTIAADGARESVLGTFVDCFRAKRVANLRWTGAHGVRANEQAPCTEAECDGGTRCALRLSGPTGQGNDSARYRGRAVRSKNRLGRADNQEVSNVARYDEDSAFSGAFPTGPFNAHDDAMTAPGTATAPIQLPWQMETGSELEASPVIVNHDGRSSQIPPECARVSTGSTASTSSGVPVPSRLDFTGSTGADSTGAGTGGYDKHRHVNSGR